MRTVYDSFQEFMRRYEPTPRQKENISRHHSYLREIIKQVYEVETFLYGEY